MARSHWILPRADAACGKAFHPDRRSAEGHRIALEFWYQATGHRLPRYALAVYRCNRCGGFHLGRKRPAARPVAAAGVSGRLGRVDGPAREERAPAACE